MTGWLELRRAGIGGSDAGEARAVTARVCEVCGGNISAPGLAMPVPPEARAGTAPEWMCIDMRDCDLRWIARERARLPGGAAGLVLGGVLDTTVAARLEITP